MSTAPPKISKISTPVIHSSNDSHVLTTSSTNRNHFSLIQPVQLVTRPKLFNANQFNQSNLSPIHTPVEQWKERLKAFCTTNDPPVILVDMDNTLVNWESQFERLMKRHYPQIPIVPPPQRKHFKIELNYSDEYHDQILHLTSLDEFWLTMDPIHGALEALRDMSQLGIIVYIVTTPDAHHTSRSAFEKITWVERHLGWEWKMRSILTHDKTLVNGDILIDDKPAASVGVLRPSWTHLLFSQPYNVHRCFCPRLDTWLNWGPTVYSVLIEREKQKSYALFHCPQDQSLFTVRPSSCRFPPQSVFEDDSRNSKSQGNADECCGTSRFGCFNPSFRCHQQLFNSVGESQIS